MKRIHHFVFQILLVLAALYGAGSSFSYFFSVLKSYPPQKLDYVVRWESDMQALKLDIPWGEKKIGYISDWDRTGFDKDAHIEYVLISYALAPQLVKRGLNYEWVIANSTRDDFLDWLLPQLSSPYTIKNYGKGIRLIHQEGP